ncbi:MAG: glycosyltransferase, partial [Verrucomicrobiota bacterium]
IYGAIAARFMGVKGVFVLIPGLGYAFSSDGSFRQKWVHWMSRLLYSVSLRCADLIFLQNRDDESLLRSLSVIPHRIPTRLTLGSGVKLDTFSFREQRRWAEGESAALRFVLVTRLLGKKGVRIFAEAAREYRKLDPGSEFVLVGPLDPSPDGVSEEELRHWMGAGLISYKGETRDVGAVLEEGDVFVLPTFYREGVPRSILEAMAKGMPIITCDGVGSRETVWPKDLRLSAGELVVEGENGWLVEPRSVEALVKACSEAAQNPDRLAKMSKRSRQLAEEHFDVHAVNQVIVQAMGLEEPARENDSGETMESGSGEAEALALTN